MIDFASILEEKAASAEITGASFAYWDGDQLHTAVAGQRNSVTGDPITLDTLMHIGSITKVLNTTLFMQLVDDGLIQLDDPVTKYLPGLKLATAGALEKITCRMLVNHTNGIDFDAPPYNPHDEERIVDAIDRCASMTNAFSPGEATSYSNIGTVIAGHLTQTVRGKGWYELMQEKIFEPLGLTHSLADVSLVPRFRVSIGDQVTPDGKLVQSARPFLPLSFAPAGATVMMTASNLVTFARALLNGGEGVNGVRILSKQSAALMAKATAKFASPANQIGLGWMILPGGVLWHGGGGPGVFSELYAHPGSGRAFAVLMNCSRGRVFESTIIDPILSSWGAATPPAQPQPAPEDLTPYEGVYQNSLFGLRVYGEKGRLFLRSSLRVAIYETDMSDQPASELIHLGEGRFKSASMGEIGFVNPDAGGRMQGVGVGYRVLMRCAE